MALNIVTLGFEYFPDPSKNKPLSNGFLYIGEPDLDPTIPSNQKDVYYDPDGLTLAQQPISLSTGGVPTYNGNPVILYIDSDYSLLAQDKNEQQAYYVPLLSVDNGEQPVAGVPLFDNVEDMIADDLQPGDIVDTKSYYGSTPDDVIGAARYKILTPAEFAGTPDNYSDHTLDNGNIAKLFTDSLIDLLKYGASENISTGDNKNRLQSAISKLDGLAGTILIDASIDYGYTRAVNSTWPNFDTLSSSPDTRIVIEDYSYGLPSETPTPPSRSGCQYRRWYFTGNQEDGQHNGNFEYVKAGWHPGYYISNDGDRDKMNAGAGINRRASVFFATNGDANWRIGQGNNTGDLTEDELTAFLIAANGLGDIGVPGLTSMMTILKTNGYFGFNTSLPGTPFDFVVRDQQTPAIRFKSPDSLGNFRFILERIGGKTVELQVRDSSFNIIIDGMTVSQISAEGVFKSIKGVGGSAFTTAGRPTGSDIEAGTMIFDTDLGIPIWKPTTGTASWVDATGVVV